jgi:hypothetical protein
MGTRAIRYTRKASRCAAPPRVQPGQLVKQPSRSAFVSVAGKPHISSDHSFRPQQLRNQSGAIFLAASDLAKDWSKALHESGHTLGLRHQ